MDGLMQDFPLTLHHLLWRMERLFARKGVVTRTESGTRRVTYGEIVRRIHRLAGALTRLGVGKGDVVGSLAWNNDRHLELYFAAPCMGAPLHTLNLRLSAEHLEYILNDAGDRVLFVDASLVPLLEPLAGKLPRLENVVVLREPGAAMPDSPFAPLLDYEALLAAEPEEFAWPVLDERDAAGICYTSGTTGRPKGVVYSHRSNLLHTFGLLQSGGSEIVESDVVLPVVPLFHANAWGLPFAVPAAGADLVLPDRWMGDGDALIDLVEREGVTVLAGVPTIWINLVDRLEARDVRLPTVRCVISGGSALPRALLERMEARGLTMQQAWGMTETSPLGTYAQPRSWHRDPVGMRLTQGGPVLGVELRIVDLAGGDELPWDGVAFGELQVRGPWVASSYLHGAEAGRFGADGWFATGDVASIDADGFVRIVDRTKDVIKSGGEWISSVELENALMSHPAIAEAAVVGLPHEKWLERPVGFVVLRRPAAPFDRDDVMSFLAERVASWWLPDELRVVAAIPRTSVGKFDKKKLRADAEPLVARVESEGAELAERRPGVAEGR